MTQRTFSRRRAPPQMLVPKPPIGSKRYRGRLGVTAALCLANSARGHAQGQNADAEPPRCRSCRGAVETILGRCILAFMSSGRTTKTRRMDKSPGLEEAIRAAGGIPALAHELDVALPSVRSEEHTSETQSLMSNSYADFRLKKKQ